jgi:hypothetical protein
VTWAGAIQPRRSALWSVAWRAGYRLVRILDPLIRSWIANDLPGLNGIVELRFPGRRTGQPRRTLVTLLRSAGHWYVGHPNGDAAWVRNVGTAGWVEVEPAGADGARFAVQRLPPGEERDRVIRVTPSQQPFPASLLYRAARRHIAAVGVYYRLVPATGGSAPAGDPDDRAGSIDASDPSGPPDASTVTEGAR